MQKGLAIFASVFAATLAVPQLAEAADTTRKDVRDSRGALDISSVSHSYRDGLVTHTLRTFKPFAGRILKGGNSVVFAFDSNRDERVDRLVFALMVEGKLRGVVANARGKPIALAEVTRPNSRALALRFNGDFVGPQGSYSWLGMTMYTDKRACRKTCTDVAPNRGPIFSVLWKLQTISVSVVGSGVVHSSGVRPIECSQGTCTARYRAGWRLNLRASPAPGWVFGGWSGACTGTGECVVTLDSAKAVTATFLPQYSLSLALTGPGMVIVNPPNDFCTGPGTCSRTYLAGTTVTLTVSVGSNYVFDGWGGDCAGTDPVCTVTMTGNRSVVAHTRVKPTNLTVSVESAPGAGGRVWSSPVGIDCPGDCSETWSGDTIVTLYAAPAQGSVFAGWLSGTCHMMGTVPNCIVSLWPEGGAERTVGASFALST